MRCDRAIVCSSGFCRVTQAAGALAVLALAGAATATPPSWYRPWVPDFDQRRAEAPGKFFFLNEGRMYCAPTATMNMFAYIDRHGYPTMTPLPENVSFHTVNSYNIMGSQIQSLASAMGTHPENGTPAGGAVPAMWDWLADHGTLLHFVIIRKTPTNTKPVGPGDYTAVYALGGINVFGIGWYDQVGSTFVKTGGHVVTCVGVKFEPGSDPEVIYRDPGDTNIDPDDQDAFAIRTSFADKITANFQEKSGGGTMTLTKYRLTDYAGPAFLSALNSIIPLYGLTSNADMTQVQIFHPFGFIGALPPKTSVITLPPGRIIADVLANPMGDNLALVRPVAVNDPHTLFRIDPSLLEAQPVLEIPVPGPIDVCRKGCVWYIDNRALTKGVPNDMGGFDVGPGLLLPSVATALTAHDGLDRILVLLGTSLRIYDENMVLEDTDTLPAQVVLSGPVKMAFDPANPLDLLITSFGSTGIHRIRRDPASARWSFVESIPVPSTEDPTDLEVANDGRVFFRSHGRTFERIPQAGGGWATPRNPVFSNPEVGGPFLDIPFSRDSEDGRWAEPNDDINLLPPSLPPGTITCDPDLTSSSDPNDASYGFPDGVLDASDFFFFLDRFVAGDLIVCDLTGASDPNDAAYGAQDGVLDASDFFFYLDLFASGCN